jgi:hypothetical protein
MDGFLPQKQLFERVSERRARGSGNMSLAADAFVWETGPCYWTTRNKKVQAGAKPVSTFGSIGPVVGEQVLLWKPWSVG